MAIRAYREQAGLLQVDLAKKLDVDQAAVSNWERGVNRPQSKYIRKMCRMFKCTEAELMRTNPGRTGPAGREEGCKLKEG